MSCVNFKSNIINEKVNDYISKVKDDYKSNIYIKTDILKNDNISIDYEKV